MSNVDFINSVVQQPEGPDVGSSLDLASRRNPDIHAESLALSEEQQLPVDTVTRQIDEVRRRKLLSEIDLEDLNNSYPHTAAYLTNTDNASVSIDDVLNLKGTEKTTRSLVEIGDDTSIDIYKGIVGLGEAVVGIADILTFNYFGHHLQNLGYNPEETKQFLNSYHSKVRKRSDRKVAEAQGFTDTFGALVEDFSTSGVGAIVEAAPAMIGMAGATRAVAVKMLAKAGIAPGTAAATAFFKRPDIVAKLATTSGISEGAITAGQLQESARQAGRTYTETVLPSVAAGALTALISRFASKLLPDVEVGFATAPMVVGKRATLIETGKEIAKGVIKEGVLEEMPQSAQEQVWTNLAMGRPAMEGVGKAGATGLIVGAGMGGGMSTGTQITALMSKSESHVKSVIASIDDQQKLDQIIEYAQSSTTNTRASDKYNQFMESLGEQEVLLSEDIASQMEGAPDYITEQLDASGTTVAIPLRKFASEIAQNEVWMELIRPHIKLREASVTRQEIEDGAADTGLQELLKRAQETQETLTEADRIFATVKERLVATGLQSEQTARYSAQLYPAAATVYVEKAKAMGQELSVTEAFEMMGFQVEAAAPGVEPRVGEILDQVSENAIETGRIYSLETFQYPLAPRSKWYGEADYKDRGGTVITMTPDEYLASVRVLKIDEVSRDNIDDLKEHIESGRQLDPLTIYDDGKEDGRHRAYAAKEMGIERVPVVVFGEQIERFRGAQVFAQAQDFSDIQLTEEVVIEETGETVTITQDAQQLWDQTQERKRSVEQLVECIRG